MKKIRQPIEKMMEQSSQGNGVGIKCPKCEGIQFAKPGRRLIRNTIPTNDNQIRRYRVCVHCGFEWTTHEM